MFADILTLVLAAWCRVACATARFGSPPLYILFDKLSARHVHSETSLFICSLSRRDRYYGWMVHQVIPQDAEQN